MWVRPSVLTLTTATEPVIGVELVFHSCTLWKANYLRGQINWYLRSIIKGNNTILERFKHVITVAIKLVRTLQLFPRFIVAKHDLICEIRIEVKINGIEFDNRINSTCAIRISSVFSSSYYRHFVTFEIINVHMANTDRRAVLVHAKFRDTTELIRP